MDSDDGHHHQQQQQQNSNNAAKSCSSSCQIVLTLAHLLQQHSLSYETEKNALLNASVHCATSLLTANDNSEEVHVILTGSPRPTFAETNAWLLEEGTSPSSKRNSGNGGNIHKGSSTIGAIGETKKLNENSREETHLKASYSIADNVHYSSCSNVMMDIDHDEMQDDDDNLQEYITEFANNSGTTTVCSSGRNVSKSNSFIRRNTTGVTTIASSTTTIVDGGNNNSPIRRRSTFDTNTTTIHNTSLGPMVGQAVVNTINQSSGVGLQSSRSKLLQGTIDRPLWSQTRWTDGECLFSELVDLCGLESFENVGAFGGSKQQQQQGPDVAAGGGEGAGLKLQKTANLSAHLITVPATTLHEPNNNAGLSITTMEEIARGIIRTLKRKKSPPASKVYIVLPATVAGNGLDSIDDENKRRELLVILLKQSWEKLEKFNSMIGQSNLMTGADLEFVNYNIG